MARSNGLTRRYNPESWGTSLGRLWDYAKSVSRKVWMLMAVISIIPFAISIYAAIAPDVTRPIGMPLWAWVTVAWLVALVAPWLAYS